MPSSGLRADIAERWKKLKDLPLYHGKHEPDSKYCAMEMVAAVAGEPWTDNPETACPIIGAFVRRWQDDMNDIDRQMLKPYIPRLVGTRSTPAVEQRRRWMLTDWEIRVHIPACADKHLAPTKTALQASALELLDRLIECDEEPSHA